MRGHPALAALIIAAMPTAAAAADMAAEAATGQRIVAANCGVCHATGTEGASPEPAAPTFRDVSHRYPPEDLGEALAEGILTGHPEMPEFTFEPDEIDAIIAYLEWLRAR